MKLDYINNQISSRKNELIHYSPTSFFRNSIEESFNFFVNKDILTKYNSNNCYNTTIANETFSFIFEDLSWDSEFFKIPIVKLSYVLFNCSDYKKLVAAIEDFKNNIIKNKYIFIEIPSEDILVIQALNESSFRLVETRMTYYLDLASFNHQRYFVREAKVSDIENLKRVSSEMVNPYDRFHADICFNKDIADTFLGVFAEESIKGFADYVMVPNEKGIPADSFLSAKYNKNWWGEIGIKVSKMVLSAVSSSTNRGWYIKLISEMAYHLNEQGAEYAIMHPASTNKAVIHSYEKLGCKLGKVSHILSYKDND